MRFINHTKLISTYFGAWKYHLGTLDQQQASGKSREAGGATRLIHDLCDRTYSYNNRLVLPSLKYQRHRGDMIMIYQLQDPSDLLTLTSLTTIGVTISNCTSQELHQESGHRESHQ